MTLNRELVTRVKLCLVSAFPDIVKDCPKVRNLRKIFLRSFENVTPGLIFHCKQVICHFLIQVKMSSIKHGDTLSKQTSRRRHMNKYYHKRHTCTVVRERERERERVDS